jgi:hypothetical protein
MDTVCRNLFATLGLDGNLYSNPTDPEPITIDGPLAPQLYIFTYRTHADLPNVGTFSTPQSKFTDPTTFIVNFWERLIWISRRRVMPNFSNLS